MRALPYPKGQPLTDSWEHKALCREYDPNLWFPISYDSSTSRFQIKTARDICAQCPVREACLAAVQDREGTKGVEAREGIWGGYTPRQRFNLARHGRADLRQRAAA